MASRVWSFLLPGAGAHELRAEALDGSAPDVFLDGKRLEQVQAKLQLAAHARTLVFAAPDGAEIELHMHVGGKRELVVNGTVVEDYASKRTTGDDSLRQLRSRPDGSYLICPDIPAGSLDLNIIRKFRFSAGGQVHEVQVAHGNGIWQVISDGHLVERVAHKFEDTSGEAHFNIQAADGLRLRAAAFMRWVTKGSSGGPDVQEDVDTAMGNRYGFGAPGGSWHYDLSVNGVRVPVCWTKVRGDLLGAGPPPVVTQEAAEEPPEASFPSPAHGPADDSHLRSPAEAQSLPQGVSFGHSFGAYQASIRAKSGRFIFLGEFATPEEAHQSYLEALPKHCPDKVVEHCTDKVVGA